MRIEVVGLNYKTTPAAVRSKVAIGSQQLGEALISLRQYVHEGFIICTCNRIEIYTLSLKNENSSGSTEFMKSRSKLSDADLIPYVYHHTNANAVQHLFRVASGLDSMVIGEYEILGQVKHSLKEASKSGVAGPYLLELLRRAVTCGRKVRVETGISKNALSVSSVAVDLAMQTTNDIRHSKILVIGCGEAGQRVAKICRERGAVQITVMSRSLEKGKAFAKEIQGDWSTTSNLEKELEDNDIVLCCSGAPHTILKTNMVEEAMKLRSHHPLVIIDIGIPCNVDREVKGLKNVFLHDIDELTAMCKVHYKQRKNETQKAEEIIESEKENFMAYWHELKIKPIIAALVNKAEKIRQEKLDLAIKKTRGISDRERLQFEMLSKSLVQKLLHEPIQCLKANHKNEEYLHVVNDLFCLEERK